MTGPMWWRTSGPWGPSNSGGNLTPTQFDQNNFLLYALITQIQAHPPQAVSIDHITEVGNQLTIYLTNGTTQGPFTIEGPTWNFTNPPTGAWLPNTHYNVLDVVNYNASVYVRLIAGTSGPVFNPNETDGAGHYLWSVLLTVPGSVLPAGGNAHQVLSKVDGTDFNTFWSYPIPPGGTLNQILQKAGNEDFNIYWATNALDRLVDVAIDGTQQDGYLLAWNQAAFLWKPLPQNYLSFRYTQLTDHATPTQNRQTTLTQLAYVSGALSIDPNVDGDVYQIIPTGNLTITTNTTPVGAHVVLEIQTTGTTSYTVTFSGTILSNGPLETGVVSGVNWTVSFIGDGNNLIEVARTRGAPPTAVALSGSTTPQAVDPGYADTWTLTPAANITLTAATFAPGKRMALVVTTSGTTSYNITFGTGFKSQGVLATGTVTGKVFTVTFVSDGINMNELARTTAM